MKTLRDMLIMLLVVTVVRTAVAEPYLVPSGSMVPTLLEGDALIAAKYAYGYSLFSLSFPRLNWFGGRMFGRAPARGDVVVFRLPRDPTITYVKRLVGLPGDRIRIEGGRLIINGRLAPAWAIGPEVLVFGGRPHPVTRYLETLPDGGTHAIVRLEEGAPTDNLGEVTVPAGQYFMLGDNRDDSLDSRVPAWAGGVGFVPEENLVGRVDRLAFSFDPAASWWDIASAFRASRMLAVVR